MADRGAESVEFREVDVFNLRDVLALGVTDAQSEYVASVQESVAEAEVTPDARPWYRALYAGDTPVGFVMISDNIPPGNPELVGPYYLWRLLIDTEHQGRGYGTRAVDLAVEYIRTRPKGRELFTSVVEESGSPMSFYLQYGFEKTDRFAEEERVLRLKV
jgi:diamine N-acetyltransferase